MCTKGSGGSKDPWRPLGSKFFQFHAVSGGNLTKSYVGDPSPGGLAPPPRENPRSATERLVLSTE